MNKLYTLALFILMGFGLTAQPTINVSSINADPGDVVCVDFSVENFIDILSIQYSIVWDPTILQFNSVTNFGLPTLNVGNFGTTDTNLGQISFSWLDFSLVPVTLTDGDIIYTVCFDVIGDLGNFSAVEVSGNPLVIEVITSDTDVGDIGIDPESGGGQVFVGDPLTICGGEETVDVGGNICVPFTSNDFNDIVAMQFSVHFDPAILSFTNVSNIHPQIASLVPTNPNLGDITVSWFETLGQGVTIPAGSVLFEICFSGIGNFGDVSPITFDGNPTTIEILAKDSANMNTIVGFNSKPGSVTIGELPTDLITNASTHTENIGANVCVDIEVSDFVDMVSMQYSLNWDPTVLQFTNINNNNLLSGLSVGTANATNGEATVSWFNFSGPEPVTLPDNSVIFQLCFDVIGLGGECSDISFTGMPLFEEVAKDAGGGNTLVNLDDTAGAVCIIPDPFVLADTTIFHIDCNNIFGTIDVEYGGGVAPFMAVWSHGPTSFDVTNLPAGMYTTTVTDSEGSSFMHTFEVLDLTLDPGTCDDDDCTNGVESWDATICQCISGIPVGQPGICDDGDCTNGIEFWNVETCNCDSGPPINEPDPGTCSDGDCTNGMETWNGCECIAGTAPVDSGCDDGDCTNGIETWDGCNCVAGTAPVNPGCDDGDCTNGMETWDGCNCVAGTTPVDPGCDDGVCSNGIETWDGCNCVAGTAPIDPGTCDDGDCTNGIEGWDGCGCVVIEMPLQGCTNNTATNFDALATCDDGSCIFPCPDPGTCSDNDCTNGLETWDGTACTCIAGTPPVDPGCDDGDCTNGIETWDGCNCVAGTAPVDPGCDDGDCTNGMETWDGCNCVAGTTPVDPGCNDGDCTNGIETWDGCDCVAGTMPVDPGTCDDGDCTNGIEGWDGCGCVVIEMPLQGCTNNTATNFDALATCDDGSCIFPCPDPGTCSDNDCTNGLETWDGTACTCIAGTPPVDPGCNDGDCTNGIETWDGCDCVAGTMPVDPGTCDDGDCTNGIEGWDGCGCVVLSTPILGCTDNDATNFDPLATCDDGSCVGPCPDPGTCDDGNCANGLEAWDDNLCECIIAQSVNLITPVVANIFNFCEDDILPTIALDNTTAGYATNWYDENMDLLIVSDQFNPGSAGNYFVGLEEMASDCEGELMAFTIAEIAPPIAVADGGGELNCLISELTLNGLGSNAGNGFTTTWSTDNGVIASGENTLSPTITTGGDYLLTVIDTNTTCRSEALISVTENFEAPVALATSAVNIGCELSIILDASLSTSIGNLTYQWTTIGGNILNGANTLMPEVNASGTYELVMTNNDNFCTASTTVTVTGTPPISGAIAGADEILCGSNVAALEGELFSTMTGFWTIPNNGVTISDINDPNASIGNLAPGDNIFVWTVSTADCVNYDQDTVIVSVEQIPVTIDDTFEMDQGETRQNFNVGLNDDFTSIDNWTFSFLSNPEQGFVTFPGGGIISFEIPENVFGQQQFTYEICNDFCLEFCDSATVVINVPDPLLVVPDSIINFPNTITPNGDGLNDFFVLDVLIENPNKFPNNDLIIFNRWGDVVYQAKPYNNDWSGFNSKGFDLPQGTYYYVVRLNIAEGDILRGEITILK